MNIKKSICTVFALLMAVLMAAFCFGGCKLTPGVEPTETDAVDVTAAPNDPVPAEPIQGTQVVMRSGDIEITLYDFGQAFYNSQYIQYYMYGMMSADQLCDSVVEELSHLIYMQRAGKDMGLDLTEEEIAECNETIETQLEQLLQRYEENVEEGAEDKRAEAIKLLEGELAEDGIDYDTFIELAKQNLLMYKLADKYYRSVEDSVEVTDDEIVSYYEEQTKADMELSVSDLVQKLSTFNEGEGPFPAFFSDDVFSVNHIYMSFETTTDDEGNSHTDTESRKDDEAKLEALFPQTADYAGFMELEEEYGEDPGMDVEGYREYGYAIHPDIAGDYFDGFVYAAMNLHEGSWEPKIDQETGEYIGGAARDIEFFELADGTRIVKVNTDSGVHYIAVNKEYSKGKTSYEKGDAIWESWSSALRDTKLEEKFTELSENWADLYEIWTDTATIKAKYSPSASEGD